MNESRAGKSGLHGASHPGNRNDCGILSKEIPLKSQEKKTDQIIRHGSEPVQIPAKNPSSEESR